MKTETAHDHQEAEQRSAPSSKIVYSAVLREGTDELERPSAALLWSAIAAGLSMGLSPIVQGLLHAHLPQTDWTPMLVKFGYSAGFLLVILGRQQLFTENTLTAVLPLLQRKNWSTFLNMLRLWGVVLAGNLVGGALMAVYTVATPAFSDEAKESILAVSREVWGVAFDEAILGGVISGWLIALMVWLLPFAESARIWVIIIVTYVVGLGELPHVIAGSIETFVLAASGEQSWPAILAEYVIPALIGNIIGGVTFVALLNHAQVVAGTRGEDA